MSGELHSFNFEGRSLRVVMQGEDPWWVATEVGSVLGLKGHGGQVVHSLDGDEKGVRTVDTPGGPQQLMCVSESGLYALIFKSRKPVAKRFRKWVTSEVLPALRKTGTYTTPEAMPGEEGYTWLTTWALATRVGEIRSTLENRVVKFGLPHRHENGKLLVALEPLEAHLVANPIRTDVGRSAVNRATYSGTLPDGVSMQNVIDAYGKDAPLALYQLNPRLFPHPSRLKGESR